MPTPHPAPLGVDLVAAERAAAAGDLPGFQAALAAPAEALLSETLDRALPTRAKAQFLLKHAEFVKGHLMEMLERFEGSAGCAEKTDWAYANLLQRFFKHLAGKPQVLDLAVLPGRPPVRILQGEAALLEAFRAIEQLYFGQAFAYMDWVNRVAKSLNIVGSDVALAPTSLRPAFH